MNSMSPIALLTGLALLHLSGTALAAAPTPNTHTVTVGGKTQTYANLPGAPISSDPNTAYQFRTQVIYSPQCMRFANEADAVFLNSSMPDEEKTKSLRAIGSAAKAANCLSS